MKFSRLAYISLCSCIVRLPQLLKLWVTLMIIYRILYNRAEIRNFSSRVVLFYINTNKIQTILFKKFFGVKGAIYYVASATVMFSHMKISSFRLKAHLVFHWCIYNKVLYLMIHFFCMGRVFRALKIFLYLT